MIKLPVRKYKSHSTVVWKVDGKQLAWLQFEKDNIALYLNRANMEVKNLRTMITIKVKDKQKSPMSDKVDDREIDYDIEQESKGKQKKDEVCEYHGVVNCSRCNPHTK